LLIPMVNPDGVVCGFYRPSLSGKDVNRVWQKPDPMMHPIPNAIMDLIAVLQRTRPVPFFLDFHGHTAACNSFVYGFMNENNYDLYNAEKVFSLLMTKHSPLFSNEMCSYLKQECYEGTMRVVIRRKFQILFAYTLEMSFGGSDFGSRHDTQFTPHDYRAVGEATARVVAEMFLQPRTLAAREIMALAPPPDEKKIIEMPDVPAELVIEGEALESQPQCFLFLPRALKLDPPARVKLVLNQTIRDVEMA
jgi:hypothetical protein